MAARWRRLPPVVQRAVVAAVGACLAWAATRGGTWLDLRVVVAGAVLAAITPTSRGDR